MRQCYPTASAELYNPATGTFTATGNMTTPRAFHTATLLRNGQVLVTGGCSTINGMCYPATSTLSSAELYNPTTGTWTPTGTMTTPRGEHTATLLYTGQVLIAGGANGTQAPNPIASAELYDPTTGAFTTTATMHAARDAYTATPLFNGTVLVTGGCDYFSQTCFGPVLGSAEVYVPGVVTATGAALPLGVARARR